MSGKLMLIRHKYGAKLLGVQMFSSMYRVDMVMSNHEVKELLRSLIELLVHSKDSKRKGRLSSCNRQQI